MDSRFQRTSQRREIVDNEKFGLLKMSFSEFGDNSTQWSWYNVPQSVKKRFQWSIKITEIRIRSHAKTKYNNILSQKVCFYATGEIYYSN